MLGGWKYFVKSCHEDRKKWRVERISVEKIAMYAWPKCKVKLAVRLENTEKYIKTLIQTGIHGAKTIYNKTVRNFFFVWFKA